jgi:cytochrome b6-f complex iron-sulfur subunit
MTRRNFFSVAGAGVMTTAFLSFLESCSKDSDIPPGGGNGNGNNEIVLDLDTPAYSGLKTAGGYAYKDNIIVAHTASDQYVALSKVCTHKGCTIEFDGTSEFPCPCHGSVFSSSGAVVTGPASSPVKKYTTLLTDNLLKITG